MRGNDIPIAIINACLNNNDIWIIPGKGNHVPPPHMPDADPCESKMDRKEQENKNVWLYNIYDDPSECVDLSESNPDKVIELLERLAFYNSSAVPVFVPPLDWEHNPDNTGGAWVPWVKDEE